MRIPDPNPPLQVQRGLAYSFSEKAEALADNLESQLKPVPVSSMQMGNVEGVREAMESFALALTSEPLLTNTTEISKAIAELKVGKAPGPNGVPNRALSNLPRKAITYLTKVVNSVLKGKHYPAVWKDVRVISLRKPSYDPTQSTGHSREALRHGNSTTLQLARLVEESKDVFYRFYSHVFKTNVKV